MLAQEGTALLLSSRSLRALGEDFEHCAIEAHRCDPQSLPGDWKSTSPGPMQFPQFLGGKSSRVASELTKLGVGTGLRLIGPTETLQVMTVLELKGLSVDTDHNDSVPRTPTETILNVSIRCFHWIQPVLVLHDMLVLIVLLLVFIGILIQNSPL